jgi:putative alpha-1,2-mannosidase
VTSGTMNDRVGAVFSWNSGPASQMTSIVGISLISVDHARNYASTEIPSWNLNDTVSDAVQEWNTDVLSKIQVPVDQSANVTNLRLLYSSLYFTHLMPSNRTGENPLSEDATDWWDDFYTLCQYTHRIPVFNDQSNCSNRGYFPMHDDSLPCLADDVLRIDD